MPDLADRVEHYSGERPVFDLYGVEDEIQRAMLKEVPLKSGGHLIVAQTVLTTCMSTGVQLREDMDKGVFDRFKVLPIARIAPLAGPMVAALVALAALAAQPHERSLGLGQERGGRPQRGLRRRPAGGRGAARLLPALVDIAAADPITANVAKAVKEGQQKVQYVYRNFPTGSSFGRKAVQYFTEIFQEAKVSPKRVLKRSATSIPSFWTARNA